jgi:hypothetical protein
MNLLVLGHYVIAPPWNISFKINLFIMLEAVTALVLGGYIAWVRLHDSEGLPRRDVVQGHKPQALTQVMTIASDRYKRRKVAIAARSDNDTNVSN